MLPRLPWEKLEQLFDFLTSNVFFNISDSVKVDAADPDIVFLIPHILLPCQKLAPTLPTMQLYRRHFTEIQVCCAGSR